MFRASDIKRLINTFGKNVTINYTNTEYDPTTGNTVPTIEPVTVRGYFYDVRNEEDYDTFVELGSRRLAISAISTDGNTIVKPEVGDTVEGHRGTVYITRSDEVLAGEQTVVYLLRVK